MTNWWGQPALVRFVGGIVDTLRSGEFVHLRLPLHAPEGLSEALHRAVGHERLITRVTISDASVSPQRWAESRVQHRSGVTALEALAEEWEACLILVELTDGVDVGVWFGFLEQFHRATMQLQSLRPHLLLVTDVTARGFGRPFSASGVRDVQYRGILSHVDMWSFAQQVLSNRFSRASGVGFVARAASIAALAGFDPDVVSVLASSTLLDQEALATQLDSMRSERGWTVGDAVEDAWAHGMEDYVDGIPVRHIASHAAAELHEQIRVRIWDGQVRTVFPLIEKLRGPLIQRHRRYLEQCLARNGTNGSVDELEVGDLANYLTAGQSTQDAVLASQLLRIRNMIAHRRVVPWQHLDALDKLGPSSAERNLAAERPLEQPA